MMTSLTHEKDKKNRKIEDSLTIEVRNLFD